MGLEIPLNERELIELQTKLAFQSPQPWQWQGEDVFVGGVFICFPKGGYGAGQAGDLSWACAVVMKKNRLVDKAVVKTCVQAPYKPGLLAMREGPPAVSAVQGLRVRPDCLIVNATGRDHPRRCGMALHLGAVLDIPTIGVTKRPLCAKGGMPGKKRGETSPLFIGEEEVASWVCTRSNAHPIVVHPGWRIDLKTAIKFILSVTYGNITPEPLRIARMIARQARHELGEDTDPKVSDDL